MRRGRIALVALTISVWATAPLWGQARTDFANFEWAQIKPITVARVGGDAGRDFLLVCNTPDNAVEIYDPVGNRFLGRVPVGQGPVTVAWHEGLQRAYTANMGGDSISVFRLDLVGGDAVATFEQTTFVGDEPWHIAFYTLAGTAGADDQETLFVSHQTPDTLGWRDALTLQPISGLGAFHAQVPIDLDGDGTTDFDFGVKEPRTLGLIGDTLLTIATKGGNTNLFGTPFYNYDIWCADITTGTTRRHEGLGSLNANMAIDSAGRLYVVGGFARTDLLDEPNVAAAETGFLQSMFYFVEDVCTDDVTVESRDLNKRQPFVVVNPVPVPVSAPDTQGVQAIEVQPVPEVVPKLQRIAMPMDVVLLENGSTVDKVFIAGQSIDRLVVLEPNFAQPVMDWRRRVINIPTVAGNPMAGPRGLALKRADAAVAGDPGNRLYVLNRQDNSVTVVDPDTESVVAGASFALQNDPRPSYVRDGEEFLFSAKHSGNHMVACVSCHIDMRTDRLAWDLGTPAEPPVTIPPTLIDGPAVSQWPADKDLMVTQSLQGLLNWEVDPEAQRLFTNAPYHWRADRDDFDDFAPAWRTLLGRATDLQPDEMAKAKAYVQGVIYPGNPKMPLTRTYTGDFGGTTSANDATAGTGAQRGLKIFHQLPSDGAGSCVVCHALPSGSNMLITEGGGNAQPIEVAALRHIFQRESRIDKGRATLPSDAPFSGITGLSHTGFVNSIFTPANGFDEFDLNAVASIDAFNRTFFSGRFCANSGDFCQELQDLNRYNHEFDTGVAPIVGIPVTIDTTTAAGFTNIVFNIFEGQADVANAGAAIKIFTSGPTEGFWFDPLSGLWTPEPGPGPSQTRAQLVARLAATADRLVIEATPLGSERRIAAPSGKAAAPPSATPSGITAQPWEPNTANVNVPLMTNGWVGASNNRYFVHLVRSFQHGILQDAASAGAFGLDQLRHEAPRRAVVSGDDIVHGAVLELFLPNDPAGPPDLTLRPGDPGQIALQRVVLPLYPTDRVDGASRPIWQSGAELAPPILYRAMLGGAFAPGVQAITNDTLPPFTIPEPPPLGFFDPITWGWAYWRVTNPGTGGSADAGWQRLTLSAPPP